MDLNFLCVFKFHDTDSEPAVFRTHETFIDLGAFCRLGEGPTVDDNI